MACSCGNNSFKCNATFYEHPVIAINDEREYLGQVESDEVGGMDIYSPFTCDSCEKVWEELPIYEEKEK